jgi:hypothetical protein
MKLAPLLLLLTACPVFASPTSRATKVLDAQIAGIKGATSRPLDTFAPDATLLVPDPRSRSRPALEDAIRRTSPHEQLRGAKLQKVVAGGDDHAVWVSAELSLSIWSAEPGTPAHLTTRELRVTELLTADAGWKVVAAAFSEAHDPTMEKSPGAPIAGATEAGPLTALLAAPDKLAAALDKSAAVYGTARDERGYGAAAPKLVAGWSKLALTIGGTPREARGEHVGFAIAYVDWARKGDKYPSRMAALVIGKPAASGGWSVVAVHYAPL